MGRSTTPKYDAQYWDQDGYHQIAWDCRRHGRATHRNAEKMRCALNKSFQAGGTNEHVRLLGRKHPGMKGGIPHISKFQIVRNTSQRTVVAEAIQPMFEVI